jgi:hypothetical protein
MKEYCIKKPYATQEESEIELRILQAGFPEFPWEVRYCTICKGFHVWKNYMAEYGALDNRVHQPILHS